MYLGKEVTEKEAEEQIKGDVRINVAEMLDNFQHSAWLTLKAKVAHCFFVFITTL
jgi:hypothetical protein